jgi:hypothetical protein
MTVNLHDITNTLAAKSDQLNAEDLAGGPMTAQIERVTAGQDHPIAVHLQGMNRPWYPCKTVRRLLVECWGADATIWPGRWVRLYREPSVMYGGKQVGGIRMDGASHIDHAITRTMQERRGRYKEFKIERITPPQTAQPAPPSKAGAIETLDAALLDHDLTPGDLDGWASANGKPTVEQMTAGQLVAVAAMISTKSERGLGIIDSIRAHYAAADGGAE